MIKDYGSLFPWQPKYLGTIFEARARDCYESDYHRYVSGIGAGWLGIIGAQKLLRGSNSCDGFDKNDIHAETVLKRLVYR